MGDWVVLSVAPLLRPLDGVTHVVIAPVRLSSVTCLRPSVNYSRSCQVYLCYVYWTLTVNLRAPVAFTRCSSSVVCDSDFAQSDSAWNFVQKQKATIL